MFCLHLQDSQTTTNIWKFSILNGIKYLAKQALKYKPKGREAQDARKQDESTSFTLTVQEDALRLTLHSS
jgi:hypothetical protein